MSPSPPANLPRDALAVEFSNTPALRRKALARARGGRPESGKPGLASPWWPRPAGRGCHVRTGSHRLLIRSSAAHDVHARHDPDRRPQRRLVLGVLTGGKGCANGRF